MNNLNLSSLKSGFRAIVVKVENSSNDKNLKQLMNMGVVKGNIIEVLDNNIQGLLLVKKENSTFGLSRELANNIFVKLI
ncbi:MAG: FeoA family protein [Proteobacteria bacterium]|nr:FeoA family protein [Pseudomonadota bacterium]